MNNDSIPNSSENKAASASAEVKPIAELIAKAREFVDDYEPEQGEPEIEERGVFRALADALESQAERIAELEKRRGYEDAAPCPKECENLFDISDENLAMRLEWRWSTLDDDYSEITLAASRLREVASLESQLKVAQLAAEELILRHPDNEKPASLANTIKLAAGLIRTQSAATERAASLESSLAAIGSDTVEGKRIEEYVAHAVGRDTAKCALAAVKAALEGTQQC